MRAASRRWETPGREGESVEAHLKQGFAVNFVLYSIPKWAAPEKTGKAVAPGPDAPFWAQPGTGTLPKDMPWPAQDPRWQDLSIETVTATLVKAGATVRSTALVGSHATRYTVAA